jgi:hypothetical protein
MAQHGHGSICTSTQGMAEMHGNPSFITMKVILQKQEESKNVMMQSVRHHTWAQEEILISVHM